MSKIKFQNYKRQIRSPFIIYLHIEALQIRTNQTRFVLKPCAFGLSVKCSYDKTLSTYGEYEKIREEDPARVLWKVLEDKQKYITEKLQLTVSPQQLTEEQNSNFLEASTCYFCGEDLNGNKSKDFYSLSGEYLGAAHKDCTTQESKPQFTTVVVNDFNKFKSYLTKKDSKSYSSSVLTDDLLFIDADKFLLDYTMEDLEKNLSDSDKHSLQQGFPEVDKFDLIKQTTYFPHQYTDSFEKLSEYSLPTKNGFFNRLTNAEISEEEYQRMLKIWSTFGCRNLDDFLEVCVRSKVLLLEDIFESFRSLCLEKYGLDPGVEYFSIAGYAWDCMLKNSRVELEKLNPSMLEFVEASSNRGGGLRHRTDSGVFCADENKSIVCLNANSLAGWAMTQCLPSSDFEWVDEKDFDKIIDKLEKISSDDPCGYILQVDLVYPPAIRAVHKDLPFLLHAKDSQVKIKECVMIHYRNLQQCLANGLQLQKIHKVLRFTQTKFLEPYVKYNTKLRTSARNNFEASLYNFFNISVKGNFKYKGFNQLYFVVCELSDYHIYDFHYNVMLPRYNNKIELLYMCVDRFVYQLEKSDIYGDLRTDETFRRFFDTSNILPMLEIPQINHRVVGKMTDICGGKAVRKFCLRTFGKYCVDVQDSPIKIGMADFLRKTVSVDDYEKCILNNEKIEREFWIRKDFYILYTSKRVL